MSNLPSDVQRTFNATIQYVEGRISDILGNVSNTWYSIAVPSTYTGYIDLNLHHIDHLGDINIPEAPTTISPSRLATNVTAAKQIAENVANKFLGSVQMQSTIDARADARIAHPDNRWSKKPPNNQVNCASYSICDMTCPLDSEALATHMLVPNRELYVTNIRYVKDWVPLSTKGNFWNQAFSNVNSAAINRVPVSIRIQNQAAAAIVSGASVTFTYTLNTACRTALNTGLPVACYVNFTDASDAGLYAICCSGAAVNAASGLVTFTIVNVGAVTIPVLCILRFNLTCITNIQI